MTTDGADALAVLNSWFEARGRDTAASTLDAWSISKHKDAWVFSPGGGRRTNRLHMVRDGLVVAYSPSTESTEAAYARMTLEAADTREDPLGEEQDLELLGVELSTENPDIDITGSETRARSAGAGGRAGAQVPITPPGKYVGDIS